MPLNTNIMKEQFSIAFCRALAACAGMNFSKDDYDTGLDGAFKSVSRRPNGEYYPDGAQIEFQAKSTSTFVIEEEVLIYDLEAKNYRDLILTDIAWPRILIVYLLPSDQEQWMTINDDDIIMRYGAYWYSLRGLEDRDNISTVRVRIPLTNKLTPDELKRLFDLTREGEDLHDA